MRKNVIGICLLEVAAITSYVVHNVFLQQAHDFMVTGDSAQGQSYESTLNALSMKKNQAEVISFLCVFLAGLLILGLSKSMISKIGIMEGLFLGNVVIYGILYQVMVSYLFTIQEVVTVGIWEMVLWNTLAGGCFLIYRLRKKRKAIAA